MGGGPARGRNLARWHRRRSATEPSPSHSRCSNALPSLLPHPPAPQPSVRCARCALNARLGSRRHCLAVVAPVLHAPFALRACVGAVVRSDCHPSRTFALRARVCVRVRLGFGLGPDPGLTGPSLAAPPASCPPPPARRPTRPPGPSPPDRSSVGMDTVGMKTLKTHSKVATGRSTEASERRRKSTKESPQPCVDSLSAAELARASGADTVSRGARGSLEQQSGAAVWTAWKVNGRQWEAVEMQGNAVWKANERSRQEGQREAAKGGGSRRKTAEGQRKAVRGCGNAVKRSGRSTKCSEKVPQGRAQRRGHGGRWAGAQPNRRCHCPGCCPGQCCAAPRT